VAGSLRASRAFVGPEGFPPVNYAAYGIVAWPALATPETEARSLLVCAAYYAALPSATDLNLPRAEQMLTVWPVRDARLADALSTNQDQGEVCPLAVSNYDLLTGLRAIADARHAGVTLTGRGPYLLAWSPAYSKGQPDALVLAADLSNVRTAEQFLEYFVNWRDRIQTNPALWRSRHWSIENILSFGRN
jgi:hypothetical protein